MPTAKPTVLEVEDEEQRQDRLRSLLERVDNSSSGTNVSNNPLNMLNISKHKTHPVEPPTELLARVQAFLPAIHASNEALVQKNQDEVNVENVEEDEEQYIEMNLGLGVFETKRRRGSMSESSTESDTTSSSQSSSSGSDESSTSSQIDSSSSNDSGSPVEMKPVVSRSVKPLPGTRTAQQMNVQTSSPQSSTDTQ
ncbi:hypothetical protein V8B97DRAFT_40395 [Scleroderma yunnanense]